MCNLFISHLGDWSRVYPVAYQTVKPFRLWPCIYVVVFWVFILNVVASVGGRLFTFLVFHTHSQQLLSFPLHHSVKGGRIGGARGPQYLYWGTQPPSISLPLAVCKSFSPPISYYFLCHCIQYLHYDVEEPWNFMYIPTLPNPIPERYQFCAPRGEPTKMCKENMHPFMLLELSMSYPM